MWFVNNLRRKVKGRKLVRNSFLEILAKIVKLQKRLANLCSCQTVGFGTLWQNQGAK